MPERSCLVCGRHYFPKSGRHVFCTSVCRERARLATRAPRPQYGAAHQRLRASLAPAVARGGVDCARCGYPIEPGEPWDLGHVDGDPSRYSGPEHRRCNRATSSHGPPKRSRGW